MSVIIHAFNTEDRVEETQQSTHTSYWNFFQTCIGAWEMLASHRSKKGSICYRASASLSGGQATHFADKF